MKRIFIYGNEDTLKNYSNALKQFEVTTVFSTEIEYSDGCEGLLLAGGGDVDPALYGEVNTASRNIDFKRDSDELALVQKFVDTKRPILGICRGLQVLNIALGGTLNQNIRTTDLHRWDDADKVHSISVCKSSFLMPIYGPSFNVNSAHHQAAEKVSLSLCPTAYSCDGVIEALENSARKIFSLQWHPERMCLEHRRPDTVDGLPVFEFFLSCL